MATTLEPNPVEGSLEFLEAIERSGLLTGKRLDEVRARVQSGAYPADAASLSKRLIRKGLLTEFQARHLLQGRTQGLVVDRFVLLDSLGKGSMGRVFKARHRLMGRVVALKYIAPELVARPGSMARFQREMRLVGRLDHPNIVRAFDAHQVGRLPCIVMEYVSGQNLGQRLTTSGPLTPDEVIDYGAQAALGLAHAHEQGIIHRDIKPSNLLLGEDGRVRLLDLGLGSLMAGGDDDTGDFATADGVAVGTIEFMSPEQAAGRPLDGRSDLFSLGCTMYHLLTGRIPFPGESKVECLARRINGRHVPITDHLPGLSPALVAIIDRLLANRPDDRFANAAEVAQALQDLGHSDPVPRREFPPVPAPAELPRSQAQASAASPPSMPTVTSTTIGIDAALPLWFRFLIFLAERTPMHGLVVTACALVSAFLAGYLFALVLH